MQREQQKRDEESSRNANMGTSTGLKVSNNYSIILKKIKLKYIK